MLQTARAPGSFFYVLDEATQILFVDDDPILREFAVVHLSTDQARVKVAADGEEALLAAAEHQPDLILLDLEMPRLDGFGALERLRADPRFAQTPILVVTGREDVAAIDRAYALGATSFVVKPINWRLLSYQIRFVQKSAAAEVALEKSRGRAREAMHRLAIEGLKLAKSALVGGAELKRDAASFADQAQLALETSAA